MAAVMSGGLDTSDVVVRGVAMLDMATLTTSAPPMFGTSWRAWIVHQATLQEDISGYQLWS